MRRLLAAALELPIEWAYASQIHGTDVVHAMSAGSQGEADAIYVDTPRLPVTVAAADCVPIIIEADDAVAVVHAGWRGAVDGVLGETLAVMRWAGHRPRRAALGPSIGPCCYEVGDEVADRFEGFRAHTTWGATSVDIGRYLAAQLDGLEVWRSEVCTYTDVKFNSYRRDRTRRRQIAVAWLPED